MKQTKRRLFPAIILFILVGASANCYSQATIEIYNSSSLARSEEVIEIPWHQIMKVYPAIDTMNFQVIHLKTKKQVPWQLEYRGTNQIQNLLVQVNVAAGSSLRLRLQKGKADKFAAKTYCRYVPERKDDFAWENDKIAFRMYGRALEKTPNEMAYGVDVWVKRTDRLILNERYKLGEYHIDHGDGLDYYHVGLTLGAGGNAPYANDTIWFPRNYTLWKVFDNGPLRSTFQLNYDEWEAAGQKVKVTKTISLDAGSQLNKVEASYSFSKTPDLSIAVGIIKRKEPGTVLFDEQNKLMGYWEPAHGKDGTTGVGCLFIQPVQQTLLTRDHLLGIAKIKQQESLIYYSGAAWDKATEINSAGKWFDYLKRYQQKLAQPVTVKVY